MLRVLLPRGKRCRAPRFVPVRFAAHAICQAKEAKRWRKPAALVLGAAAGGAALTASFEPEPDEETCPRVYDAQLLADYWSQRPWAVRRRCLQVLGELVPYSFSLLLDWRSGILKSDEECHARAVQAREILTRLGPAFIKVGQALSIRPDLIPASALKELQRLCDNCPPFAWSMARSTLEKELGCDVAEVFDIGEGVPEPVAAASLGQVYRWCRKSDGSIVAVKVQRPGMACSVALDVYILRIIASWIKWTAHRLTKTRTDHVMLLDTWAAGTFGELDYEAEANHQERFRAALCECMRGRVYVPDVCRDLTSRHVLVTEWVTGPKLADCPPEVVKALVPIGVECFLAQLLDLGVFHSDPHPGNLLVSDGRLVLLDFGLVADIPRLSTQRLATLVVSLINADCEAMLDDFIALGFLPVDIDRQRVLPPLKSVVEQGMKAGGDIRRRTKNFQAISDDLNDVFFRLPFEVPGYFALITRAIAVLEGAALVADPEFDMFWAAYPHALSRVSASFGPRRTAGLITAAAARAAQDLSTAERASAWQWRSSAATAAA